MQTAHVANVQIVTESISNSRTIQALCKENYMYQAYCAASREPHRRAIVRGERPLSGRIKFPTEKIMLSSSGLWQAFSLALSNCFVMVNFAIAYAFGLWLISNGWSTPFVVFQ